VSLGIKGCHCDNQAPIYMTHIENNKVHAVNGMILWSCKRMGVMWASFSQLEGINAEERCDDCVSMVEEQWSGRNEGC